MKGTTRKLFFPATDQAEIDPAKVVSVEGPVFAIRRKNTFVWAGQNTVEKPTVVTVAQTDGTKRRIKIRLGVQLVVAALERELKRRSKRKA